MEYEDVLLKLIITNSSDDFLPVTNYFGESLQQFLPPSNFIVRIIVGNIFVGTLNVSFAATTMLKYVYIIDDVTIPEGISYMGNERLLELKSKVYETMVFTHEIRKEIYSVLPMLTTLKLGI